MILSTVLNLVSFCEELIVENLAVKNVVEVCHVGELLKSDALI